MSAQALNAQPPPLPLANVNVLSLPDVVWTFGGALEHSPRYAEGVGALRPFAASPSADRPEAGLGCLTPEEYAEFHRVNAAYHAEFDLPCIVCVRENTGASILSGAATRLEDTPEQEQATAPQEIGKIIRLRILDLVRQDEGGAAT